MKILRPLVESPRTKVQRFIPSRKSTIPFILRAKARGFLRGIKSATPFKSLLLLIVLQSVIALTLAQIYVSAKNTLHNNGRWTATKTTLEMGVMGAANYWEGRQALARDALNLGAWYGHQEVIYKEKVNPQRIGFDFWISDNSYFYFIFNKDPKQFLGIRISTNKAFKNMYVKASADGEFRDTTCLSMATLKKRWNHAEIIFAKDSFSLFINKRLIGHFKETLLDKQEVGFIGSSQKVLIDNLCIYQRDSRLPIKEDFSNRRNLPYYSIISFVIISVLNVGIVLLFGFLKKSLREALFNTALINGVLIVMTSAYAITDYYFFAPSYLTPSVSPATTKENVEEWVRKEHERINAEIMERYGKEKTETGGKDIYRILFIGTSQTWGAGARTKQECFVNLLENKLNRELNSTYTFECINAGISGSNSTRLLEYYGKHWLALQPKLVIINLSANDWNDPDQFYRNLNQFVLISKAHNIKTIFSLEAIPLEAYGEPALSEPNFLLKRTLSNHNTMIRCTQENNIFVLNLHGYLRKKYDDGILWWDCAHLRPFGHRLTASYIFDNIKDFIR